MANVGYGVTPMSRLSQNSSRCRAHTGRTSDFCSPNSLSNKKVPKRKTLCSRYTAVLPSKRRRIGLNTFRDPSDTLRESHLVCEAHRTAGSPKTCNSSEASPKEKEGRHSGTRSRGQKTKAGARGRPRGPNTRVNGSRGSKVEVSAATGKRLDLEEFSNEETFFRASLEPESSHVNASPGKVSLLDGGPSHNRTSIPSLVENLNYNVDEAGASLLARKNDFEPFYTESRQITHNYATIAKNGRGRKSRKQSLALKTSTFPQRISKDVQAVCIDRKNDLQTPSGSHGQELLVQDVTHGSSFLKKDAAVLEGSFLRPRRKVRKKSSLEEHRLPPWDYVGERVVVYWPHAKAWYAGKVIMYDETSKKHKIKYDDSDEECISFRRHKVLLERAASVQVADVKNKGAVSTQITRIPKEEVRVRGPVKRDPVDDMCAIEDNALLSAFASRHRIREFLQQTSCNGSAIPSGAVKGLDVTASKNTTVHKSFKRSISLAPQDNSGRSFIMERGTGGGKEAFVYVRRTKGRRKLDAASGCLTDERIHEPNVTGSVHEQEISRKRKSSLSSLKQGIRQEFLDRRFCDDESSCSDAPAMCSTLVSSINVAECSFRKRNKRSLKKLVSQASVSVETELSQESELQQDFRGKSKVGRPKKKFIRKVKLKNAQFAIRNRSLVTQKDPFLPDDTQCKANDCSHLTTCHNVVKPCNALVQSKMFVSEAVSSFVHTINLMLPAVVPGLFTWQLFSILSWTHFCDGNSFDDTFFFNGSMGDWKDIFRVLLRIVESVPLSSYLKGRQWQCIILHELWSFLQRCELVSVDTLVSLPSKAELSVAEQLLDASTGCRMSNREIFNLFVCYFIKPYILATLCDKGLSIQVIIQQFLLFARNNDQGMACLQQSVKRFPLKSNYDNVDESFSTYLMHVLRPTDWYTGTGLFLRQMEEYANTAKDAGFVEIWNPLIALEKLDQLVWRVISTHVVHGENMLDKFRPNPSGEKNLFKLKQATTIYKFQNEICFDCPGHGKARSHLFDHERFPLSGPCINAALLAIGRLQKTFNVSAGKGFGSIEDSVHPLTVPLSHMRGSAADKQAASTEVFRDLGSADDASEKKASVGLSNFVIRRDHTLLSSCPRPSSQVLNTVAKLIKVEPDINLSRRNSSITTESTNAAIKEESSVEMHEHREPLDSLLLKADLVGQTPLAFDVKNSVFGHMGRGYYDNGFLRDVRMAKKSRPRFRGERHRQLLKRRPTYFCTANILFLNHEYVERDIGARVELRSNADSSFQISVYSGGKSFEQKIIEGGTLAKNPPELLWRSGNGWELEFPDKGHWELFRCMYNELCSQAMRAACVKEIPIPVVKELETAHGDDSSQCSLRPFFAITTQGDEIEMAFRMGRVLYDLDSEDETWMAEISRDLGSESMSDDTLEQVIDRLEKEAYRRGEETVTVHDAIELCQGVALVDCLRAVHTYWTNKRLKKGMPLLRYFQPPLWEQFQDELQAWENRMQQYSSEAQSIVTDRYPRPIMSAFCLQSRSFDSLNNGKRMLRQRSQRKIRPTSRSCFDDSHRLPVCRDGDSNQYLTDCSKYSESSAEPYQHLDHDQDDDGLPDIAKAARVKAAEARRVAEKRALKLQRQFLEFDLAIQRAWALLIEYTVSGGDVSTQSECLDGIMAPLFASCSGGNDWSEDELQFDLGQTCSEVGEDFLEAFSKQCSLNGNCMEAKGADKVIDSDTGEVSPLLPVFVKGTSYAWNGSSLL